MKVTIIGTGYVGLVTGACFADKGIDVTCVDNNQEKIENLNKGIIPIYEPGLEELIIANTKDGRLHFTTDIESAIKSADVVFSAVGTPPDEDGSADLSYVLAVARKFGECIDHYAVFVTKSTVPVGTADKVKDAIKDEMLKRFTCARDFGLCSNPEFLKEGSAVKDVLNPDRVIIGTNDMQSKKVMNDLYKVMGYKENKIVNTDIKSAEMIKYAANSMLAVRISFINEIANLCEKVGADVECVSKGIGMDSRIGPKFLKAGCGYGGSCFPKDVKALIKTAQDNGIHLSVVSAAEEANEHQKTVLYQKLYKHFNGDLKGKLIAILGCAFKPETDDMREAPALYLVDDLTKDGANINITDPIALDECERRLKDYDNVNLYDSISECIQDSDAVVLVTEWHDYKKLNFNTMAVQMNGTLFIDGRNMFDRKVVERAGLTYDRIG